jgi:hypothetical protein
MLAITTNIAIARPNSAGIFASATWDDASICPCGLFSVIGLTKKR